MQRSALKRCIVSKCVVYAINERSYDTIHSFVFICACLLDYYYGIIEFDYETVEVLQALGKYNQKNRKGLVSIYCTIGQAVIF